MPKLLMTFFMLLFLSQISYAGYDDFTVNVPNEQGAYTAIVIKKSGTGYVGPQGEYYATFPSVYQLQVTYKTGVPATVPAPAPVVVEQPIQQVVTTQVIYPSPQYQTVVYQRLPPPEDDDDDYYRPVIEPQYEREEILSPRGPVAEENITFEFKKKKKHDEGHQSSAPAPSAPTHGGGQGGDHHNHDHDKPSS